LCIAFAPVKGEKPELIVQKLTELGIDEIIPLAPTSRSVVRWDAAKAEKQTGRLQRVANEASMQSRRVWLPKVHPVTQLADLVSRSEVAFAEPGGVEVAASHRTIVVGPEGGFAPEELNGSVSRVSLGESVLRAETAAIVAGALMTRCRRGEM
jgi:16S rRNA (uracil1498-N3)-methyltransferase